MPFALDSNLVWQVCMWIRQVFLPIICTLHTMLMLCFRVVSLQWILFAFAGTWKQASIMWSTDTTVASSRQDFVNMSHRPTQERGNQATGQRSAAQAGSLFVLFFHFAGMIRNDCSLVLHVLLPRVSFSRACMIRVQVGCFVACNSTSEEWGGTLPRELLRF